MTTRTRLSVLLVVIATAGSAFMAVHAGAAPTTYITLDQAASQPIGIGDRERIKELPGNGSKTAPSDVLKDSGSARGGCDQFYGEGGQCLPKVPPSQAEHVAAGHMKAKWECREVRTMFKDGIVLANGNADPYQLDRNKDGVACGRGD